MTKVTPPFWRLKDWIFLPKPIEKITTLCIIVALLILNVLKINMEERENEKWYERKAF